MENMNKSFIIRNKNVIGMDVQRVYTSTPVGVIQAFSGTTIPRGFLLCNGASYKTTDYPELFDIIGYTYGGSDGTFNVPNLCDGRFLEGSDTSGEYVEAGLPNITGTVGAYWGAGANGAFTPTYYDGAGGVTSGGDRFIVDFDASKSNAIYSDDVDTVQPKSLRVLYIIKAFHTNEGVDSGVSDDVVEYVDNKVDGLISDTTSSATSTYSSAKIDEKYDDKLFGYTGGDFALEIQLDDRKIDIEIVDNCGGKIELLGNGAVDNSVNYRFIKVLRLSYGNWTEFDATKPNDTYTKIKEVYVDTTNKKAYVHLKGNANYIVKGAKSVISKNYADVDTSTMTLIPESKFTTMSDLATQTANRQVKTFDNTGTSTEKWYKICSALTTGIGCNIKLTASRADSTATVQYFSALFRDSRYRYTSSYISRERTVYESALIAEYSAYIIADANNDIWVHVPSYGKAIIEIDTRAITIDGTVGTPVEDYVYSSFEHRNDGRIDDSATNSVSTWSSSKIASRLDLVQEVSMDLNYYDETWLAGVPVRSVFCANANKNIPPITDYESYAMGTLTVYLTSRGYIQEYKTYVYENTWKIVTYTRAKIDTTITAWTLA